MLQGLWLAILPIGQGESLPLNQALVAAACRLLLGLAVLLVLTTLAHRRLAASRAQGKDDPFLAGPVLRTASQLGLLLLMDWSWAALPVAAQANQLYQAASGLVALLLVVRLINGGLEHVLGSLGNRLGDLGGLERVQALMPMLRGATWLIGALVYLQNQGLQLTAVLGALAGAGLGIGFALQAPARDFFSYITILLDQPFQLGQLLRFDDVTGRVLKVGLRSTQLRSLDGELVVINNANLLAKTLRNYGDQVQRRVLQRLLLRLDSGAEAAAHLPELAQAAIGRCPQARFERCHLLELTPGGLLFELAYVLDMADPGLAFDRQQAINLDLLESLERSGLLLADPAGVGSAPKA
ncbi:MAG: mechanosensitive ion channel [Cyanobacteria bacterium]|nr:mechanosensitive ion channel [Cyanobacteriota bacterium]